LQTPKRNPEALHKKSYDIVAKGAGWRSSGTSARNAAESFGAQIPDAGALGRPAERRVFTGYGE
jgi:hypothetical protein